MYASLKNLYLRGKISDKGLDQAVKDGFITLANANEIKSLKK